MKTKKLVPKRLVLVAWAMLWFTLNLDAQTAPTITTQPTNQTLLPGGNVTFTVAVAGTGPFTYQWQFSGTNLPNNIITTVAGNGFPRYQGDGVAATNTGYYLPQGVALDAFGNIYIADTHDQRVREVNPNGIVSTLAGSGTAGFSGDTGPATSAKLSSPTGVARDNAGNLYIADEINNRVRVVNTNGIITTVAGNGSQGYSGDGAAATAASCHYPVDVKLDNSGNLYIADSDNNCIRMVETNGIITTVAGNGSQGYSGDGGAATGAKLNNPQALAFDAGGNLYIADAGNNRIRMVDTNGNITTLAGNGNGTYGGDGGAATNASLDLPSGVIVDSIGNVYIADKENSRIRKVDTAGNITTLAGNGTRTYSGDGSAATNASLYFPSGLALDSGGNLYIADTSNGRIREVLLSSCYPALTLNGVGATNAGNYTVIISNPSGSVTSAVATLTVQAPPVITVQPAYLIAVFESSAVFSVTNAGSGPFGYLWYSPGNNLLQSGPNNMLALTGITTNDAGSYTVVVTNSYGSVTSQVATLTVVFLPSVTTQPIGQEVVAGTNVSFSVMVDGTGPFRYQWQVNGGNLPTNIITTIAGIGTRSYSGDGGPAIAAGVRLPSGVASDAFGNLYIADTGNNCIRKVDTNGIITTVVGNGSGTFAGDGGMATNASLDQPAGVVLDVAGNLYIADKYNYRIREVATNGIITTVAGSGNSGSIASGDLATNIVLASPSGVALDASGNLYIADTAGAYICKVNTNGILTFAAGDGMPGFTGDGIAATQANLYNPCTVAFDSAANMYIADTYDERIRKVGANGIISTVAGNGNGIAPGSGTYGGDGGAATNAGLNLPSCVAVDSAGDFYIADTSNQRIRKVDVNGIISTAAGNGIAGFPPISVSGTYSGDGGTATNAGLNNPAGVALDWAGNLYIADTANNRIREVNFAGSPTLSLNTVNATNAGSYSVVVSNPYGSVTSAIVTLTVTIPTTPPQIIATDASFGFLTNGFGFNVAGSFGQTIVVDASADFVGWIPLFTNTLGGSQFYFSDPASTNLPLRFYRARLQ